jgi:hypothetical protein
MPPEFCEDVRRLRDGESLDIATDLSSLGVAQQVYGLWDDDEQRMVFQCEAIPGGVRVTCEYRQKTNDDDDDV